MKFSMIGQHVEPPYCNKAGHDTINSLQEQLKEAVGLLTDLWQYDNLREAIDGVVYSNGTHSEIKARVTDFLYRHAAEKGRT